MATILSADSAINADLDLCAQGDIEGLRRLVASQSGRLRASVERRVGNAGLAERVVHDVFVHIWEVARAGRPPSDYPVDWIFAVARAKADEALRAGDPKGKATGSLDPVRTVQRRLGSAAGTEVPSAVAGEGRRLPFLNGSRPTPAPIREPEPAVEESVFSDPLAGSIDDMRMRRPGLPAEAAGGSRGFRRIVAALALVVAIVVALAVGVGFAERAGLHSPLLDPWVSQLKAVMSRFLPIGSEPVEAPLLAPETPATGRPDPTP